MQKSLFNNSALSKAYQSLKFLSFFVLLFGLKTDVFAQAGSVGIGTNAPYVNAVLDVTSTTKGVLLPRLTQAQRTTLTPLLNLAANGLLIYNTTTLRFNYWNGTQWNDVGLAGANGADGTVWFADNGVPSNAIGKPSDFYLDGVNGDVYKKDISNTWVRFSGPNPVNLKNANKREVVNAAAFIVPATSALIQTYPFVGAVVGNAVVFTPNFALADGLIISYARVSATDVIEVKFYNVTGVAINNPIGTYEIAIIKQ